MGSNASVDFVVVLTTVPDVDAARALVRTLVDRRIVACGTVVDPVTSIYRWEGAVEEANEVQVLVKTHRDRFAILEEAMHELHPYDVPELLALPVADGSPAYLAWVRDVTMAEEAA